MLRFSRGITPGVQYSGPGRVESSDPGRLQRAGSSDPGRLSCSMGFLLVYKNVLNQDVVVGDC